MSIAKGVRVGGGGGVWCGWAFRFYVADVSGVAGGVWRLGLVVLAGSLA